MKRRPSNPKSRLAPAMDIAKEIGVPYTSLRSAVQRGELPVVKLGRAWYFDRRDVEQWIERKKREG